MVLDVKSVALFYHFLAYCDAPNVKFAHDEGPPSFTCLPSLFLLDKPCLCVGFFIQSRQSRKIQNSNVGKIFRKTLARFIISCILEFISKYSRVLNSLVNQRFSDDCR